MHSEPVSEMLDVNEVAALLKCSRRHVFVLRDSGRLPQPVKLGALARWPRESLSEWIKAGCPAVSRPRSRPRRDKADAPKEAAAAVSGP